MKKQIALSLTVLFIISSFCSYGQGENSIANARKENIIKLLNYRFKGGYYTFEKMFRLSVTYPELAKRNCATGIAIVNLIVNCEGVVEEVKIKTPIGFGIDNEIRKFISSTEGHWNTCSDNKYTKVEIPVQFRLEGAETNTTDALLVYEDKTEGYNCNDDEYFIKRIEKYMEKGKYRKAILYIDVMIKHDPYNSYYYDLKMKAINGGE